MYRSMEAVLEGDQLIHIRVKQVNKHGLKFNSAGPSLRRSSTDPKSSSGSLHSGTFRRPMTPLIGADC